MAARSLFYAPAECRINRKYVASWWFFRCNAPRKSCRYLSLSFFRQQYVANIQTNTRANIIFKPYSILLIKSRWLRTERSHDTYLQHSRGLFICIIEEVLVDLSTWTCTKPLSIMHRRDKDHVSGLILYEMARLRPCREIFYILCQRLSVLFIKIF